MTFCESLDDLQLQATTTRMSDRRHLSAFCSLVVTRKRWDRKATARVRKYAKQFGWL
jgi:hypothetical protein